MPRARSETTGTLRMTANGPFAQFSIGGGQRQGALLVACRTEAEGTARKLAIAKLVDRLRAAGYPSVIENTIERGAIANADEFRKLVKVVDRIIAGKEPGLANGGHAHPARRVGITVQELAKLWTDGDLARQYPDHVKAKKTRKGDASRLAWLNKVRLPDGTTFGERAVTAVTLDDCDHAMGALPKTTETPAARRCYAQALRKLLAYAVFPVRLLTVLPIPTGWLPKGGNTLAKAWLYPSEDEKLMRYTDAPLARRIFYGLLVREGLRVSEALALTWPDIDAERGVIRLDVNKTDDPRSWVLGADVALALKAWRKVRRGPARKSSRVFPPALVGSRFNLAKTLREELVLAGVTRPELTKPKEGRLVLRAHDLRGSFVTMALAAGRTEAWVTDRTGHKSSQMIYRYKRASRQATELNLGWFAPLHQAIPELAGEGPPGANGVQTGGAGGTQVPRRGPKTPTKRRLATSRYMQSTVPKALAASSTLAAGATRPRRSA